MLSGFTCKLRSCALAQAVHDPFPLPNLFCCGYSSYRASMTKAQIGQERQPVEEALGELLLMNRAVILENVDVCMLGSTTEQLNIRESSEGDTSSSSAVPSTWAWRTMSVMLSGT